MADEDLNRKRQIIVCNTKKSHQQKYQISIFADIFCNFLSESPTPFGQLTMLNKWIVLIIATSLVMSELSGGEMRNNNHQVVILFFLCLLKTN